MVSQRKQQEYPEFENQKNQRRKIFDDDFDSEDSQENEENQEVLHMNNSNQPVKNNRSNVVNKVLYNINSSKPKTAPNNNAESTRIAEELQEFIEQRASHLQKFIENSK